MEKKLKVIFLLVTVFLSILLLASAFDFLVFTTPSSNNSGGSNPGNGSGVNNNSNETNENGVSKSHPLTPTNKTIAFNSTNNISNSDQIGVDSSLSEDSSSFALFSIKGITDTAYLRNLVGETYQDGNWLLGEDDSSEQYNGGQISHNIANYTSASEPSFEIQPLTSFGGFIPSTKDTNWVSLKSSLQYYADQEIFFSENTFTSSYNLSCTSYRFDEKTLEEAQIVPGSPYTDVPPTLLQKLKPLAINITQNLASPFEQAVAIQDFLRQNYHYDLNYTRAPANVDPVEWFLFNTTRGVCTHFNSAFVLLARSLGIPARLCAGFLIDASSNNQIVKSSQRHAYAEVLFKDIGWITFDATGSGAGPGSGSEVTPFVKILYPTQGSYVSGQTISIVGEALGFNEGAELSISDTSYSLTFWKGDFEYDNSSFINDGTYTVAVRAGDLSGNNASDAVTFTVDNTPPLVKIESPANGTSLRSSSILINGNVRELNKDDLEPHINDSRFALVLWDSSSGTFSFANTTEVAGDVSLSVSFQDLAGNTGSASVAFRVEAGPSMIATRTLITFCSSVGIKGSTFTVEGQVVDTNGNGVNNLNVVIYLTKNKNESGTLCGQGATTDGYFTVTCYVSKEVEVGSYHVVARAIGTGQYEDSWSDPDINIMAQTDLTVTFPSKAIMGRAFTVNGLLKENSTNQPIANQTVFLSIGGQDYVFVTDNQGSFSRNYTLWSPGNYSVLADYGGSDVYLSNTTWGAMRILEITLLPTTSTTLIRGENGSLTGRVFAEDLPLDHERLNVSLGDALFLADVPTNGQGYFNFTFLIPKNQPLGPTFIWYVMQLFPTSARQNVTMVARTSLTCDAPETLNRGDTLNFTAALKNDQQEPIPHMQVNLECAFNSDNHTSFENLTDSDGNTEYVNISLPSDAAGNLTYTVSFPGNAIYLPSTYSGSVKLQSQLSLYSLLPIIVAVCSPSLAIVSTFIWKKKKNSRNNLGSSVVSAAPVVLSSKKKAAIHIGFPQIPTPFPPVWGAGESLIIELDLNDRDRPLSATGFSLKIDEETESFLDASGSKLRTDCTFQAKGMHRLKARFSCDDQWEEAVAEAEIKIVNYREEIVDVFNSFFKSAKTKFQGLNGDMTPRELQATLVTQIPDSKREPLETATSIFEVADYSLHEVARKHYEQIYLALNDIEG